MENEQFEELIIQPALSYYNRHFVRGPAQTDNGLGWKNIWHRLQEDHGACLQLLRMSLDCFRTLCHQLEATYGLQPTLNVSIEESVAMFLRICGHNEVQRDVGLRFGRTQETVKRKFFEVLKATELLACDYIHTPTRQELHRIPERLMDGKYWPFFSGFVGAMDGVHVCAKVKPELQGMYWNRHDRTSFNIMAICDICCSHMFGMEPHDLVMIHQFLRWRKTMILNFRYHHRISIMLLTLAIQINKVFLLHIDLHETWSFDIICHNSKMLLLLGTNMNFLIVGMHLCVQLLKGHLEFGKRNGGFSVIFQDIILKCKKEWYWLQWVCIILLEFRILWMMILQK